MLLGGLWSGLANLGLYSWALGAGRALPEARSLAFASLVLMEFFKAFCFRSDRRSILDQPLANGWLNLAILWEILLLSAVVHVPVFHRSFGGARLTLQDWGVALLFAASIVPVLEIGKWLGSGPRAIPTSR